MKKVYLYVLNTMADWELSYISAELASARYFKKNSKIDFKTVSSRKSTIRSMGGLTIVPDITLEEIEMSSDTTLLLPGGDEWNKPENKEIINIAKRLLEINGTVVAICGATVALANEGILDNRYHTSNGVGFLDYCVPSYKGQTYYKNEKAVIDKNLITAGCTNGLYLAKLVIDHLDVFSKETLEAWYQYFSTGSIESFYALMNSINR